MMRHLIWMSVLLPALASCNGVNFGQKPTKRNGTSAKAGASANGLPADDGKNTDPSTSPGDSDPTSSTTPGPSSVAEPGDDSDPKKPVASTSPASTTVEGGDDILEGDDGTDDSSGDPTPTPGAVIVDDGTVTGTESGEVEVQQEVVIAKLGALTITGLRKDRNVGGQSLVVTSHGKTTTVYWPAKGETVTVPGACGLKTANVQITVNGLAPSNPQCFLGKPLDANTVAIGVEEACDSLKFNRIDDSIARFHCDKSTLTIKDLRLDSSIDLAKWTK